MIALALALALGDTPVEAPIPAGVDPASPWKAVFDGGERPVQFRDGKAVWIGPRDGVPLAPGGVADAPEVEVEDVAGKHLVFRFAGKEILRYNHGIVEAPEGVDPVFSRSGYLHPVRAPDGRIVTNDFPPHHLHHHGVWFPWTSSHFEGRKVDFWNSKAQQGKVEAVEVLESWSGPVFGGFRARHRFVDLTAPGGPKVALHEIWEVRVYAVADPFVFDLVSTQTCATDAPLVIKEYRYGGLGFRGSGQWEGPGDAARFLTSEGKTRADGHATRARWCTMSGDVDGKPASVGFLCHPSNFRAPQPMRIHPKEPFFNWAPSQAGDFAIEPGEAYVSRYRFVVRGGPLGADEMERHWEAYAAGPATPGR